MNNITPLFSEANYLAPNRVGEAFRMRSKVAFDIGANKGKFIPGLLDRFDSVHAFEPVKDQFDELCKISGPNLKANFVALSNNTGRLEGVNVFNAWSLLPDSFSNADKSIEYADSKPFSVDVTTVDLYCEQNGVDPDYIKLDVDGFEPFVIEGAISTLSKKRCPIFMEYSYLPERFFGYPKEKFVQLIYELGYRAHSIDGNYCAETPSRMLGHYPYHTSYDVMLLHEDF